MFCLLVIKERSLLSFFKFIICTILLHNFFRKIQWLVSTASYSALIWFNMFNLCLQVIKADRRVAFMWELQPDDSAGTPAIHTEFSVCYRPLQCDHHSYITYRCPFDVVNYKVGGSLPELTLFMLNHNSKLWLYWYLWD